MHGDLDALDPVPPSAGLPVKLARRLDSVCDRFEAAWLARPRIEDFLEQVAGPDRAVLLHELLLLDLDYRCRSGDRPVAEEYRRRLPEYAAVIDDIFAAAVLSIPHAAGGAPIGPAPAAPGWPTISGYKILRELGRGSMGVVYKAVQIGLNRVVALKRIHGNAGQGEMAGFRAEAQTLAQLQHPQIVQVFEVGEHDGRPFFSMEFMEGGSLNERVWGQARTAAEAAAWVAMLARAMQVAHDHNIVHRDLKPANVLFGVDGALKITDFGLAKRLDAAESPASGDVLGTPNYMPPEQALGQANAVGPTADVYSLGAILYELLIGRPPFSAATAAETLHKVVHEEPVPPRQLKPKVPRELEIICLKCLQKKPADRYLTAAGLAEDLDHFLGCDPVLGKP